MFNRVFANLSSRIHREQIFNDSFATVPNRKEHLLHPQLNRDPNLRKDKWIFSFGHRIVSRVNSVYQGQYQSVPREEVEERGTCLLSRAPWTFFPGRRPWCKKKDLRVLIFTENQAVRGERNVGGILSKVKLWICLRPGSIIITIADPASLYPQRRSLVLRLKTLQGRLHRH